MASVNNVPPLTNPQPVAPRPQPLPLPPIVPMEEEENVHAGVIIGVVVFVVVIIIIVLILLIMALIRYRKANQSVNDVENTPINPTQTELPAISNNYIRREQPVQAGQDIPSTPLAFHDSNYDYPTQSCSLASGDLNRRPNFDNSGNSADFYNYDTLPVDKKPVPYYPQNPSKPVLEQKYSHYDYIGSKPRKVEPVYDHPPASPRPVQEYPKTDYYSSNSDAQVKDNAHNEQCEPIYANYGEGNNLEISNEVIADSPLTTKPSKKFSRPSLKIRFSSSRKKNKSTIAKHNESFEEPIYANEPCSYEE